MLGRWNRCTTGRSGGPRRRWSRSSPATRGTAWPGCRRRGTWAARRRPHPDHQPARTARHRRAPRPRARPAAVTPRWSAGSTPVRRSSRTTAPSPASDLPRPVGGAVAARRPRRRARRARRRRRRRAGGFARRAHEQMLAAPSWQDRFAVLDRLLPARLRGDGTGAAAIRGRARVATAAGVAGRRRVEALAAETGWSAHHLGAVLRREVGLRPRRPRASSGSTAPGGCSPARRRAWRMSPQPSGTPTSRTSTGTSASSPVRRRAAGWRRRSETSKSRRPSTWQPRPHERDTAAPMVWPTLRAKDAPGLIRFLVEGFGFREAEVVADGEVVNHAELRWPLGGGIMLGSARTDPADPWALTPGDGGRLRRQRRPGRPLRPRGDRRRHRRHGAVRHRLRLAGVRRPRPRGQPLVLRHLSGAPA